MNKESQLLEQDLIVINVGLKSFGESLEEQEVEVIQVNWEPPAAGDQEMINLLDELL